MLCPQDPLPHSLLFTPHPCCRWQPASRACSTGHRGCSSPSQPPELHRLNKTGPVLLPGTCSFPSAPCFWEQQHPNLWNLPALTSSTKCSLQHAPGPPTKSSVPQSLGPSPAHSRAPQIHSAARVSACWDSVLPPQPPKWLGLKALCTCTWRVWFSVTTV